jgi:putative nucleotidyltransferase with HDIG domain
MERVDRKMVKFRSLKKASQDGMQRRGTIQISSRKLLFYAILFSLFFALLWMIAKPYFGMRYNYELGQIVQENIVSTKDITYINAKETEKRREEAKKRVPPVFNLEIPTEFELNNSVTDFFSIFQPEDEAATVDTLYETSSLDLDLETFTDIFQNNEEMDYAAIVKSVLSHFSTRGISTIKREDLENYRDKGIILKKIQETEITEEKVEVEDIVAREELEDVIISYVRENYNELDTASSLTIQKIVLLLFKPNMFYNSEESQRLLNGEINKVQPVLNTIKKGAIVIRRGEEINEENVPKLRAISVHTSRFNLKAIIGIGILLLILLYISIILFMDEGSKKEVQNYLIFAGFALFSIFYAYLITLIKNLPEHVIFGVLIPIAGITMTAEVLFKRKFSLTLATILPILLLLISGKDPYTFLFTIGSGLVAIYAIKTAEKRSDLLRSSIFIIITNELLLAAVGFLRELSFREFLTLLIWGAGNGIVSVVLSLGIIPFLEVLLNLPTNFRLLELSDLNTPIMKKMQIEAPGTYHHSINVANMAENAARAVKANALLVRVAALYHDIGKIPNAEYYVENNQGENKHNFIKPSLSNSILKAHVKMGLEMAKEMKLPREVLDIVTQHHGTSLMKYFYHQAVRNNPGEEIDKKDYHYVGPKPQNREAAIVMLADAVEAASRTLKNPSAARIDEFVNEMIESKFREGQLNESTLTLRGLMKISIAFRRYLTGVFHSRIEYPDDREIEKEKEEKA